MQKKHMAAHRSISLNRTPNIGEASAGVHLITFSILELPHV